ncbi:putative DNA (cytosine-5-)-methyltransferase [Rosa chinensis]|uniref:Putative DNA (Cytosine-5-)-methyltransferase n=1 Tax=Rosa chinensis TaxID=74649 RepID=A0A2P6S9D3_ROSCH|nr:putative DNA (cytosine-5-)-methyltransferase [Rosa chinensis]
MALWVPLLLNDTVAHHLSVLKDRFPQWHQCPLSLLWDWWCRGSSLSAWYPDEECCTNQRRNLYQLADVQKLNADRLEHYISSFGGFDLVIGGSPCNNLAGGNRHHRDGLEGKESSLFYDYFCILDLVKGIMARYN